MNKNNIHERTSDQGRATSGLIIAGAAGAAIIAGIFIGEHVGGPENSEQIAAHKITSISQLVGTEQTLPAGTTVLRGADDERADFVVPSGHLLKIRLAGITTNKEGKPFEVFDKPSSLTSGEPYSPTSTLQGQAERLVAVPLNAFTAPIENSDLIDVIYAHDSKLDTGGFRHAIPSQGSEVFAPMTSEFIPAK